MIDQVRGIAQTGLTYASGPYDLERYYHLMELSSQLLAASTGMTEAQVRDSVIIEKGYATPKIDVRGAVFHEGKILLCREREDGLFTLPGGWADIGLSAAENVEKEIREESGFEAKAIKLIAVFDRVKHGHPKQNIPHLYKFFFLCRLVGGAAKDTLETSDSAFFASNEIPPLSRDRVTEKQIEMCFAHANDPARPTEFD